MAKQINIKENKLSANIRQDETLRVEDNEKYFLFLALADKFTEDLSDNLLRNSIELADKYNEDTTSDQWQEFLAYPTVTKYRKNYIDEQARNRADKEIISGDKMNQGLAVRDNLEKRSGGDNRFNFVVFRLPKRGDSDDTQSI